MVADVQRVRRRAARSSPQLEYHLLLLVTLGLVAFGLIMVYSASSGTAVVEGHFKVRRAKGQLDVTRGSILFAREDGRWHIAILREWPTDGLTLDVEGDESALAANLSDDWISSRNSPEFRLDIRADIADVGE